MTIKVWAGLSARPKDNLTDIDYWTLGLCPTRLMDC